MPSRGLTLAEVVVALGLLGVVMVSTVLLFLSLQSSSSKTGDLTPALAYAQSQLDAAAQAGPPDWGGLQGQRQLYSHDERSQTTFAHQLTVTHLYSPPTTPLPMGDLYRLEVEVYWWSDTPGASRRGHGRLSTRLGRVVFVEQ